MVKSARRRRAHRPPWLHLNYPQQVPRVDGAVALLPIGSFEQHGPYLPLVTDTLIATVISESISHHHNAFQLPPLAFGCSHEHAGFPGTVSISAVTLSNIVSDIVDSLRSQRILGLIIVNAHGGNYVLSNVVQEAKRSRSTPNWAVSESRGLDGRA